MRFVTFMRSGELCPGAVAAGSNRIVDLSPLGFSSLLQVIEGGKATLASIREQMASGGAAPSQYTLDSVRLAAPIPRPRKLICVGLNYRDHAAETGQALPDTPTIFNKFATAVIGNGDPVMLPRVSKAPDYEAEFAFVIGTGGRHIRKEDWRGHTWGYTMVNDVSARDYQRATSQWLMGKTFDTFAPIGPWIVTADEIADPHALRVQMHINGERMQDSNTRELIFGIGDLIAFLSSVFTLEPGDIVSTGTPAGVGVARTPPRFLRPGDEMVVTVEGLGELRNPVIAEG